MSIFATSLHNSASMHLL